VLLADDHALMLEGLQKLLEQECEVVAAVEDGRSLVEAAQRLRPAIVLLDISMPLLNGLEAARQLKHLVPETKLVFLTMHADPTRAREAFDAGASGYMLKRSTARELMEAIRTVLRGRVYLSPLLGFDAKQFAAPAAKRSSRPGDLTARQREVLQLVAEGYSMKEIGARLNVSVKTVEFHKAHLMEKLGLRTTVDLVRYAVAHGYVGS
jgi:DNA-binding NarL/FixJ family response regulator